MTSADVNLTLAEVENGFDRFGMPRAMVRMDVPGLPPLLAGPVDGADTALHLDARTFDLLYADSSSKHAFGVQQNRWFPGPSYTPRDLFFLLPLMVRGSYVEGEKHTISLAGFPGTATCLSIRGAGPSTCEFRVHFEFMVGTLERGNSTYEVDYAFSLREDEVFPARIQEIPPGISSRPTVFRLEREVPGMADAPSLPFTDGKTSRSSSCQTGWDLAPPEPMPEVTSFGLEDAVSFAVQTPEYGQYLQEAGKPRLVAAEYQMFRFPRVGSPLLPLPPTGPDAVYNETWRLAFADESRSGLALRVERSAGLEPLTKTVGSERFQSDVDPWSWPYDVTLPCRASLLEGFREAFGPVLEEAPLRFTYQLKPAESWLATRSGERGLFPAEYAYDFAYSETGPTVQLAFDPTRGALTAAWWPFGPPAETAHAEPPQERQGLL